MIKNFKIYANVYLDKKLQIADWQGKQLCLAGMIEHEQHRLSTCLWQL